MKTIFVFILVSFLSIHLFSQSKVPPVPKYSLSVELGKSGLIYSVVFDNALKDRRYGLRGGFGGNFGKYTEVIMAQVGAYRLFGAKLNFFETGIDLHYLSIDIISDDQVGASSFVYPDYTTQTYYVTFNAGYRARMGKMLLRVGAAPGFTKDEFIPGAYISAGVCF
jgi:hypothetical protein